MDSFPPNSNRTKTPAEKPREKVERITTSEVIQRKKPLGRRFTETFVGGDARGTLMYVVADILVPAAKDMVADAVSQGVERMIFGESRGGSRRGRTSPGIGSVINYNRMSTTRPDPRRDDTRNISRTARSVHNFDEIILATRVEAELVIDRLTDLIQQYDVATVSDLYNMVGITESYTDAKWGWDDMSDASVRRINGGYLLDLPTTKAVD
jgi:hypothetical protein